MTNLPRLAFVVFCLSSLFFSCGIQEERIEEKGVFTVSYPYGYSVASEKVFLELSDLQREYGLSDFSQMQLLSLNNQKQLAFELFDSNNDDKADVLGFTIDVNPKEPLLPFGFYTSLKKANIKTKKLDSYVNNVKITWLKRARDFSPDSITWSTAIANTFMNLYPDACSLEVFAPKEWTYTNGFYTNALCRLFEYTNDSAYIKYAKNWADCFVTENGIIEVYKQEKYRLDDVLPGRTILEIYKYFPEEKYRIAADNFIHHIETQPRNTDGGYWHKKVYEHQMWLDGIYMGDVFTAQYAKMFAKPELFNEAVKQIDLIFKHTRDSVSGLLYHGYDESRNDVWANPKTGTSPEFWGRGMGWYMMALVDVLEYLPVEHPEREKVIQILKQTSLALSNVQDANNGLWYQVLDKGSSTGNWIETSCSAMFAYAFVKGYKEGFLDESYLHRAEKAFDGLKNNYIYFDEAGNFYLTQTVKVGTLNFKDSDGSYGYYINVDRRINDFKGVGAILYLAMELDY